MSDPHRMRVRYGGGDSLEIEVRDHVVVTDQPVGDGGEDRGPTPTELFVASLASCMGFYAERFLRRNEIPADGLEIDVGFSMATQRPIRVSAIEVDVTLPRAVPEAMRKPLERVMQACTVHNSLHDAPTVELTIR